MSTPPSPIPPPDLPSLPHLPDPTPDPSHHPSLSFLTSEYTEAIIVIRSLLPKELRSPKVGIVCGSGLQGLVGGLEGVILVPYEQIPGFSTSTVKGHQSSLAFGYLGPKKVPVVCQLGRLHAYEGHSSSSIIYPMQIMKLLGIESVVITNAAGGVNDSWEVGTVCVVWDHVGLGSLTSMNPLIGKNKEAFGPRFPPMSDAYDFPLRVLAFKASQKLGFPKGTLREGVYAWVAGPTYETRAEQRFLRAAGADVVGMSTVPEVIAARHAGIRVLVLSLVTNIVVSTPYRSAEEFVDNAEIEDEVRVEVTANHQEVLDVSALRAEDMRRLVEEIVGEI